MTTHTTDVAIIGAGPAGLFAAFECGMLKMRCHLIDALPATGGQLAALYPEKPIYDIPGYPNVLAGELAARLYEQAAPFDPVYHLNQQVVRLEKTENGFLLETSQGAKIACKAVIVAAGAGAFGPNRPPLERLDEFENKSVFYMVRRRDDFKGKDIVIAGGGDSAVDWALSLAGHAGKIFFVHRRDKFRAAPDSVEKLHKLASDGLIEIIVPYQLKKLHGENGNLEAVEVADLDGQTRMLEAQALLAFFGLAPDLGPISRWGLGVDMHHIPVDPSTCETKEPGVFAIGDVATYKNKLKLILNGFAEAATAAHAIHPLVFPGEALHFEYSTTKGIP